MNVLTRRGNPGIFQERQTRQGFPAMAANELDGPERDSLEVGIYCLRPNATSLHYTDELMQELNREGYGEPSREHRRGRNGGSLINLNWNKTNWDIFVQEQWPNVLKYKINILGRNSTLREARMTRVASGDVLYIVPTEVARTGPDVNQAPLQQGHEGDEPMQIDPQGQIDEREEDIAWQVTIVGDQFGRKDRLFHPKEPIQKVLDFVRELRGATPFFELEEFRTAIVVLDDKTPGRLRLEDLFSTDITLRVVWLGVRGIPSEDSEIERFLRSIRYEMLKLGEHRNVVAGNLDDPWGSFLRRNDRKEYKLSRKLMIKLMKEGEEGEEEIPAIDEGGPKRAYLYHLMCALAQSEVCKGIAFNKILIYSAQEFERNTYFEMGAAVALCLGANGPSPTFIGRLMAKILGIGVENIQTLMGTLERNECLRMGYITIAQAEEIARLEHAEDHQYLTAAAASITFFDKFPTGTFTSSEDTFTTDQKEWKDMVLYDAVVGQNVEAYRSFEEGLENVGRAIRNNPEGFAALCRRREEMKAGDLNKRWVVFAPDLPYQQYGLPGPTCHAWMMQYVRECEKGQNGSIDVSTVYEALTGMPVLDVSGTNEQRNLKMRFKVKGNNDFLGLPMFNTCEKSITLALPCENYEVLKKRMNYALSETQTKDMEDRNMDSDDE